MDLKALVRRRDRPAIDRGRTAASVRSAGAGRAGTPPGGTASSPAPAAPEATELSRYQRESYRAVAEALAEHRDGDPAAALVGRRLADDGVPLTEALDGLARTCLDVTGSEPPFTITRALAQSWSETAVNYLNTLSCEDPLTGLATLAHLRSRLGEIYREAERDGVDAGRRYALVVVETPTLTLGVDRELRLVDAAESLRLVYCGSEVLARVGNRRAIALVARDNQLPESADAARGLLSQWRHRQPARVWIEGLPESLDWAEQLLDELAR